MAGSLLVDIVVQLALFSPGVSDEVRADARVVRAVTALTAAAGAEQQVPSPCPL